MENDYEEINKLMNKQNQFLEDQKKLQNQIVDTGLKKTQNEVKKQKSDLDKEANKQARALYTDYQKQINPYGTTAENLAEMGLNKSGYAETSKVNLYNTYQRNVTELINNTTKLKAEADFNMNQAYLDADVQKAQNSLAIYQQRAQLALNEYDLRFNREQYIYQKQYQKERDAVADSQWERQYNTQKDQWERQFTTQNNQWEKQFALQQQQMAQNQANWEREYQLSLMNLNGGSS